MTPKYPAEKVPLPERREGLSSSIRALGNDESFLIPTGDVKPNTRKIVHREAVRLSTPVSVRKVPEGLRVYRVAKWPKRGRDSWKKQVREASGENSVGESQIQPKSLPIEVKQWEREQQVRKEMLEIDASAPEPDSDWIEDPKTFENGEILYWHHKPKCKPVCYHRESDLGV